MVTINPRSAWGARAARSTSADPIYSVAAPHRTGYMVHHTVTGTGNSSADVPAILRSIQNYHMDSVNCNDIGYNYLIDLWGGIWEGRGYDYRGAHAGGNNSMNFGVAFIGNNNPTTAAETSFAELYAYLNGRTGKTLAQLGHRDVNATACPGQNLYDWLKNGGLNTPANPDYARKVRTVCAYLNSRNLAKTSSAVKDGIPGPNYWWMVQTAGRMDGKYPAPYIIDGIPGPKTRETETHYYNLAKSICAYNES